VKQQDIHEGLWGVYVEFGIGAANIQDSADSASIHPSAIVPIKNIGIQVFPEANNLTIDAAQVNPVKKYKKSAI